MVGARFTIIVDTGEGDDAAGMGGLCIEGKIGAPGGKRKIRRREWWRWRRRRHGREEREI